MRLIRREIGEVQDRAASLQALRRPDETLKRSLTVEERAFIASERVLSALDYRYWAERYAMIERDPEVGGGVGILAFWETQELALELLAKVEETQFEQVLRGGTADGIRIAWHKARQLGATMMSRTILTHRATTGPNFRAMSASVDEDKIFELYRRDKTILDNLPWYMKPSVGFDVKAEHLNFDKLGSFLLYQQSQQKSGLGQGRQFQGGHLTECAFWPFPGMIEMDFFPTLPRSLETVCILESTANGRGNWWHRFTEEVRKGMRVDWHYKFVPWYAESKKYRRTPPEGWQPSEHSLQHAQKVYETSPEWVGKAILLPKDQLYWWETEREAYRRNNQLNVFLTNWCATPEESFQHSGQSAFSIEFLEQARLTATPGTAWEVTVGRHAA